MHSSSQNGLSTMNGFVESKQQRAAFLRKQKWHAGVQRKEAVARSGVPASDRVLHRRCLKASEQDLFSPPTRVAPHHQSDEERARWYGRAWESFQGPSLSVPFGPAPKALLQPRLSMEQAGKAVAETRLPSLAPPAVSRQGAAKPPCPSMAEIDKVLAEMRVPPLLTNFEAEKPSSSVGVEAPHSKPAEEHGWLAEKWTRDLEKALCALMAGENVLKLRPNSRGGMRAVKDTLAMAEEAYHQGLSHVQPDSSRVCRLAIVFLKVQAYLNHRIGSFCPLFESARRCSAEKVDEVARSLLSNGREEGSKLAEVQPSSAQGVDLLEVQYNVYTQSVHRAMEFLIRSQMMAEISNNGEFFKAVERASVEFSFALPADSFAIFIKEAIRQVNKTEGVP